MIEKTPAGIWIPFQAEVEVADGTAPVDVCLHYTTDDPWAVTLMFPKQGIRWVFSRCLLFHGRFREMGLADVHVSPYGRTRVEVYLRDDMRQARVVLPRQKVDNFLRLTTFVSPVGAEPEFADWDGFIASVLEQQA